MKIRDIIAHHAFYIGKGELTVLLHLWLETDLAQQWYKLRFRMKCIRRVAPTDMLAADEDVRDCALLCFVEEYFLNLCTLRCSGLRKLGWSNK
jgi:hypothetical protein